MKNINVFIFYISKIPRFFKKSMCILTPEGPPPLFLILQSLGCLGLLGVASICIIHHSQCVKKKYGCCGDS